MGEELTRPGYTVYGNGQTPHNYNHILYPETARELREVPSGGYFQRPSPGVEKTVDVREFYSPIPPNSAACLGCHDTLDAAAHTYINTAPFGESCGACHGANAEFAVAKVHAQ
jgi:hypothetical protein